MKEHRAHSPHARLLRQRLWLSGCCCCCCCCASSPRSGCWAPQGGWHKGLHCCCHAWRGLLLRLLRLLGLLLGLLLRLQLALRLHLVHCCCCCRVELRCSRGRGGGRGKGGGQKGGRCRGGPRAQVQGHLWRWRRRLDLCIKVPALGH